MHAFFIAILLKIKILQNERQCGSIYQYIIQEISVILYQELLIDLHFSIKVESLESFSCFPFRSNFVTTKVDQSS